MLQSSLVCNPFSDHDTIVGSWNGLPDVALKKILEKLKAKDRVRLRLVSKSWKRVLTRDHIPETPWQIKCGYAYSESESFSTRIRLVNTFENRVHVFRLPELLCRSGGGCICGSARGWLLVAINTAHLFLWNPLSSAIQKLPPIPKFLFTNNNNVGVKKFDVLISDQCIVAVIFSGDDDEEQLALCTPHEVIWCLLQGNMTNYLYEDILFHNGKLYALAHDRLLKSSSSTETNYSIRLPTLDYEVQVRVSCLVYKINDHSYSDDGSINNNNNPFEIKHGDYIKEHLVESSSSTHDHNELLVVTAIFDKYVYNNKGGGPVESFECHQTKRFEVRKYPGLERLLMGNLGGQQIFVGSTGSLCIPANVEGVVPNQIAFLTNDARGIVGDDRVVAREHGNFTMGVNFLSRIGGVTYQPSSVQSRIGWFTPKPL